MVPGVLSSFIEYLLLERMSPTNPDPSVTGKGPCHGRSLNKFLLNPSSLIFNLRDKQEGL